MSSDPKPPEGVNPHTVERLLALSPKGPAFQREVRGASVQELTHAATVAKDSANYDLLRVLRRRIDRRANRVAREAKQQARQKARIEKEEMTALAVKRGGKLVKSGTRRRPLWLIQKLFPHALREPIEGE